MRTANSTLKQDVAERLGLLRRVLGITQKELATRISMSVQAYSMVETGERPLHIEDALRLRAAYGVALDWIYAGDMAGMRHELASALVQWLEVRKLELKARRLAEDIAGPPKHRAPRYAI